TLPPPRQSARHGSGRAVRLRARDGPGRRARRSPLQLLWFRRPEREPGLRPMSASRRVVVTGMGSVSAGGIGGTAAGAPRSLGAAASPIRPVRAFDTAGWPSRLGAEVDDAALEGLLDPAAARRLSRICRLTVAACRLAVEDSG